MDKFTLHPPKGSVKKKKIRGRGNSSGRGGTSGKGHKGQNARSGGSVRPGFEGGQMPLYRRIARRGFSNFVFKKNYQIVNVATLEERFESSEEVTKESLLEKGIIRKKDLPVKVLGDGELKKALNVHVNKVSASAREKIEKAGGQIKQKTEE